MFTYYKVPLNLNRVAIKTGQRCLLNSWWRANRKTSRPTTLDRLNTPAPSHEHNEAMMIWLDAIEKCEAASLLGRCEFFLKGLLFCWGFRKTLPEKYVPLDIAKMRAANRNRPVQSTFDKTFGSAVFNKGFRRQLTQKELDEDREELERSYGKKAQPKRAAVNRSGGLRGGAASKWAK